MNLIATSRMSKKLVEGLEGSSSQKRSLGGHNPIQSSSQGIRAPATSHGGQIIQPVNIAGITAGYPLQDETSTISLQSAENITAGASQLSHTPTARQVIAVSASKGPAAFFNLARKFLATDDVCDLSALEGAIVSAVDAAHLLERSKLATIVRVQTSYVAVEPKRKFQQQTSNTGPPTNAVAAAATTASSKGVSTTQQHASGHHPAPKKSQGRSKGAPLRRARMVITVRRTEAYTLWLAENPHHLSGDGDQDIDVGSTRQDVVARPENVGSKNVHTSNP